MPRGQWKLLGIFGDQNVDTILGLALQGQDGVGRPSPVDGFGEVAGEAVFLGFKGLQGSFGVGVCEFLALSVCRDLRFGGLGGMEVLWALWDGHAA